MRSIQEVIADAKAKQAIERNQVTLTLILSTDDVRRYLNALSSIANGAKVARDSIRRKRWPASVKAVSIADYLSREEVAELFYSALRQAAEGSVDVRGY